MKRRNVVQEISRAIDEKRRRERLAKRRAKRAAAEVEEARFSVQRVREDDVPCTWNPYLATGDLGRRVIEVTTASGVYRGDTDDSGSRAAVCWLWRATVKVEEKKVSGYGDTMREAFEELGLRVLREEVAK